jgi:hypothetical protein
MTAQRLRRRLVDFSGRPIFDALGDRVSEPAYADGVVTIGPLPRGIMTLAVDMPFYGADAAARREHRGRGAAGGRRNCYRPAARLLLNVDVVGRKRRARPESRRVPRRFAAAIAARIPARANEHAGTRSLRSCGFRAIPAVDVCRGPMPERRARDAGRRDAQAAAQRRALATARARAHHRPRRLLSAT